MHSNELRVISIADGVATFDDENRERKLLVHFLPHERTNQILVLRVTSQARLMTRALKPGSLAHDCAKYLTRQHVKRCLRNITELAARCEHD